MQYDTAEFVRALQVVWTALHVPQGVGQFVLSKKDPACHCWLQHNGCPLGALRKVPLYS